MWPTTRCRAASTAERHRARIHGHPEIDHRHHRSAKPYPGRNRRPGGGCGARVAGPYDFDLDRAQRSGRRATPPAGVARRTAPRLAVGLAVTLLLIATACSPRSPSASRSAGSRGADAARQRPHQRCHSLQPTAATRSATPRGSPAFQDNLLRIGAIESAEAESDLNNATGRAKSAMLALADTFERPSARSSCGLIHLGELETAASTLTQTADVTQELTSWFASAAEQASSNVRPCRPFDRRNSASTGEISRQVHESRDIAGPCRPAGAGHRSAGSWTC